MPAIKDWKTETDDREKYGLYLASREWGVLKEAVHKRADGTCERCRKNPIGAVHHQTYVRKYQEKLDDLVGPCKECHAFTHGKSDKDPAAKPVLTLDLMCHGDISCVQEGVAVSPPLWFMQNVGRPERFVRERLLGAISVSMESRFRIDQEDATLDIRMRSFGFPPGLPSVYQDYRRLAFEHRDSFFLLSIDYTNDEAIQTNSLLYGHYVFMLAYPYMASLAVCRADAMPVHVSNLWAIVTGSSERPFGAVQPVQFLRRLSEKQLSEKHQSLAGVIDAI